MNSIKTETSNSNIHLILCDLGELESMSQAANELKNKFKQIDVLVHNGGCMLHKK